MTHGRHGELLAHGFHVGDLVSYERSSGSVRYGVVTADRTLGDRTLYATFADDIASARNRYARGRSSTSIDIVSHPPTLLTRFDGTPTERSNTMTAATEESGANAPGQAATEQGTWVQATEPIPTGARFRKYWPDGYHGQVVGSDTFAYEGTMLNWDANGERTWVLDRSGSWTNTEGETFSLDHSQPVSHYAIWVPAEVVALDSTFDGQGGSFEPHNGQIPEPGTIVRAMHSGGSNRQMEGLFLRLNSADPTFAWVDAKRRRNRRADGTFTEWEMYSTRAERSVLVEGATVFVPGGRAPEPKPQFNRLNPITDQASNTAVEVGMILSCKSHGNNDRIVRGRVVEKRDDDGYFFILATHEQRTTSRDRYADNGLYNWTELVIPERVQVAASWEEGRENWNRAGWIWEELAPGQKPTDPSLDPARKTPHTGMKIGDLVVGRNGGRDTVSSWVRGTLFKWDLRNGNPIVKVTDPMESGRKVDSEVTLSKEDVYPALADPKGASPEEFKKTLRLYLIGRHKRGDFCRGGLNTMLVAFGIPLYETKRRAVMQIVVDYDPNTTDLYSVQTGLQRGLPGVQGLSFGERSGEDIELAVESDVTNG